MLDIQAESELYTVRIAALTDFGIPLVADLGISLDDRYWKFPGGGNKKKDRGSIFRTALRETRGELNIELKQEECECVAHSVHESGHIIYLVFTRISGAVSVPEINVDNELVRIYSLEDLSCLIKEGKFLPQHLELLQKAPKNYQEQVLLT